MNFGFNCVSNFDYTTRAGLKELRKKEPDILTTEILDVPEEEDTLAKLQKSIKEFEEITFTGITEEDRKKMNRELQQYLYDHGLAEKKLGELKPDEIKDLSAFIKDLMKKYQPERKAEDFGGFFLQKNDNSLTYKYNETRLEEILPEAGFLTGELEVQAKRKREPFFL